MREGYVTHVDAGYFIAETRVSLDSIVFAFLAGRTAEAMAQSFPVLTLEQVRGAVAYYLAHRQEIDEYLAAQLSRILIHGPLPGGSPAPTRSRANQR